METVYVTKLHGLEYYNRPNHIYRLSKACYGTNMPLELGSILSIPIILMGFSQLTF